MPGVSMRRALLILPFVVLIGLAFVTTTPCACATPEMVIRGVFQADPHGSPEDFRQSLLKRLPPGTAWPTLGKIASINERCVRSDRSMLCTWRLTDSVLGVFHDAFSIEFLLDQNKSLVDVRVRRFREWLWT